jgi:hypothetical protein
MPPLVVVLLAGGVLGVAAPIVLGRLERLDRAPQAAAYLWLLATAGALSAVVLCGLLLVVGSSRLLADLAVLLRTCTMALRAALDTPTGAPGPLIGLALWRWWRAGPWLAGWSPASVPGVRPVASANC